MTNDIITAATGVFLDVAVISIKIGEHDAKGMIRLLGMAKRQLSDEHRPSLHLPGCIAMGVARRSFP